MYEVEIKQDFSAAHCLRQYPGDCAELHGHNWVVEVAVRTDELDELGIAVDFRTLRKILCEILSELDHKNLNEVPEFLEKNPSSENIARWIFERMSGKISAEKLKVTKVRVRESADSAASYAEDIADI